jgi:hypothetical protein
MQDGDPDDRARSQRSEAPPPLAVQEPGGDLSLAPVLVITDRTLQAPGVRCVTWSEIAASRDLDLRAHVVVDPADGTDHLQANLARALGRDRPSGLFQLWVLNSHVHSSLLELGLEPLRSSVIGEVSSPLKAFRGVSLRPVYQLRPARRLVPVCEVSTAESGRAVVGALHLDRRVLAAPGGAATVEPYVAAVREAASVQQASLAGLHAAAIVLLLLLVTLIALGEGSRERGVVDLLRVAEEGEFWVPSPSEDETWASAEAHMADRLVRNHLKSLAEAANGLSGPVRLDALGVRSEHMLLDSMDDGQTGPWPPAKIPFFLALLTGDVTSSFRVLRAAPSTRVDPTGWIHVLNATYWQTAVESLHELQFDKAVAYAELYVAGSHHVVQQAQEQGTLPSFYARMGDFSEWESGLVGERNRTLAQILLREARAGRLGPICTNPGASLGFGHVLPLGGGEPITARMVNTLEERRAEHRPVFCSPGSRYNHRGSNFLLLPRLQELRSAASLSKQDFDSTLAEPEYREACQAFPLECGFSRVIADLKMAPSPALDNALTAAVRFAGTCTYLSDDALYLALRRSQGVLPGSTKYAGIRQLRAERRRAERRGAAGDYVEPLLVEPGLLPPAPLPASVTPALLAAALGCVTPRDSDLYPTVADLIKDVPCGRLGAIPGEVDPASLLMRARTTCRR